MEGFTFDYKALAAKMLKAITDLIPGTATEIINTSKIYIEGLEDRMVALATEYQTGDITPNFIKTRLMDETRIFKSELDSFAIIGATIVESAGQAVMDILRTAFNEIDPI